MKITNFQGKFYSVSAVVLPIIFANMGVQAALTGRTFEALLIALILAQRSVEEEREGVLNSYKYLAGK